MKLIDLNPIWIGYGGEGISDAQGNPVPRREGIGISFDCPSGCEYPIFIPFENPLDGGPIYPGSTIGWKREGSTFETLTLSPSILRKDGCQWHGFIRNGDIIQAL